MRYPDTIKLAKTQTDMYGDRTVTELSDIQASFIKRAGYERGVNMEGEISDATVYLNPANPIALANKDILEGMYILSEPFSKDSWYRITSVNIAERKLLTNKIDNIYCRLEKIAGLAYEYIS